MERTDPRWVVAQIDVGWAVCGASGHVNPVDPAVGAAYVIAMINKFSMPTSSTNRIVSFHVKDVDNVRPTCGNPDQRELGQGDIDYAPIFAAAKNRVKYYFAERDPVAVTPPNPTNFNPFTNTANSAPRHEERPGAGALCLPADVHVGGGRHARGLQRRRGSRHQRRRRAADHHQCADPGLTRWTSARRTTSRSSARTAPAPATSVRCSRPRRRWRITRRHRRTRRPRLSRPGRARSTSVSSRRAAITRRWRGSSSRPIRTTRWSHCCWPARARSRRSARSAATWRAGLALTIPSTVGQLRLLRAGRGAHL